MTAAAAWRWMFTSPARYARLLCLRLGGRGRSWGCNTDCSELEPGGGVSLACTRREKLLFSFRLFGQIHYALVGGGVQWHQFWGKSRECLPKESEISLQLPSFWFVRSLIFCWYGLLWSFNKKVKQSVSINIDFIGSPPLLLSLFREVGVKQYLEESKNNI